MSTHLLFVVYINNTDIPETEHLWICHEHDIMEMVLNEDKFIKSQYLVHQPLA